MKLVSGDSEFLLHPAHGEADHAFAEDDGNNADDDSLSSTFLHPSADAHARTDADSLSKSQRSSPHPFTENENQESITINV